jgi:hypothetical protein
MLASSQTMSHKRKFLQGSASNITRVLLSILVALVLPPLLVRHMAPAEYSAWVLILQCSAYINLLDLGLQTAVGKFVAEYDTVGNHVASSRILSSSFAILCISAAVGAVAIALVCWRVPHLFVQMPTALIGDLREGILVVGLSAVASFLGCLHWFTEIWLSHSLGYHQQTSFLSRFGSTTLDEWEAFATGVAACDIQCVDGGQPIPGVEEIRQGSREFLFRSS